MSFFITSLLIPKNRHGGILPFQSPADKTVKLSHKGSTQNCGEAALNDAMLYQTQFYVAEGSFDRLKKRALALMAKNGGQMDRSGMLRHLHVDATTLKKVITTLCMCDLIESEMESNGKVVYSIRNAA